MITQTRLKELLHYDPEMGVFTYRVKTSYRVNVGDVAGCDNGKGYLQIRLDTVLYKAHRLAWLCVHGSWPRDQIDHINLQRGDNRHVNLREATNSENQRNALRRSDNTSGAKGVHWNKAHRKWQTYIGVNKKRVSLGYFDRLEDAAAAYAEASKRLHKEYGRAA